MAIRRRTTTITDEIEIDDSVDRLSNTPFPTQPAEHLLSDAESGTLIGSPKTTNEEVFDSNPSHDSSITRPTIGRTFADLIMESKNDYRIMAVVLTVVAFLIFITKIDITKVDIIESFKYPFLFALLLNCIWFGATPFLNFLKWLKRKK